TMSLQRSLRVRAELLTPPDVARIEPRIDASRLGAVLYEPDSGYADPSGVAAAYAAGVRRRGVTIEQDTEVISVRVAGGRVTGVETARGERIETSVVVNAAGLWSPGLARLGGVELPI